MTTRRKRTAKSPRIEALVGARTSRVPLTPILGSRAHG